MRWSALGVALLVACGGRANQIQGEPQDRVPDMSSPVGPEQPSVPPSSAGSSMPAGMTSPAGMAPQSPSTPQPAMDAEPPVAMPEPPVVPPGTETEGPCTRFDETSFIITATEQSTIDQLAGCEELYALEIRSPLDLRPLASLRRVFALTTQDVEDLTGLENLERVNRLTLTRGIGDLRAFSGLRRVESLGLGITGLVDFTGFENVTGLVDIDIQDNSELESLDGLVVGDTTKFVLIHRNPALRDVTSLGQLRNAQLIELVGNHQLTGLPAFDQLATLDTFILTETTAVESIGEVPLITELNTLLIRDNAALERFEAFPALQYAGSLTITGNPSLVEVGLPQLTRAGGVHIQYNEALDGEALGAQLAGVSAIELRVAPDQTQLLLDPCPWKTDPICDENGAVCAPGTDPICQRF